MPIGDKSMSMPSFTQIEVTSRCTNSCPICPRYSPLNRADADMSMDLFREIVRQMEQYKFPLSWIHNYGEPLLHPELEKMLGILEASSLSGYGLGTNGVLLNDERARMLSRHTLNVIVAVDSHRPDIYARLRGKKQHDLVVENTKRFIDISRGGKVRISIQGMMTGEDETGTQAGLVAMFGFHPHVSYIWKRFNPLKNAAYMYPHTRKPVGTQCRQPYQTLIVNVNGVCTACCLDHDLIQPIGDVNAETLLDIWNGEKRRLLIERLCAGDWGRLPGCAGCMNVY